MSLAYNSDTETPEYVSRTEIHYMFRVSMAMVAKAVDKGQLELHFIDGKILVKVAEAQKIFGRNKPNLFK